MVLTTGNHTQLMGAFPGLSQHGPRAHRSHRSLPGKKGAEAELNLATVWHDAEEYRLSNEPKIFSLLKMGC